MKKKNNSLIISLGGAVVVSKEINLQFLNKFKKIILNQAKKRKVVICVGGGETARKYIKALEKVCPRKDLDLIGIAATRLNAKLIAGFLTGQQEIPSSIKEIKRMFKKKRIVVYGGLKPGMTTDGATAMIAEDLNAQFMINITNVKGLYDKDPKKHRSAKLIPQISYKNFEKMMNQIKKKPGQHFVLDSCATLIVKKSKIKVVILGEDLKNLEKFLNNKSFVGTVIS